MRLPRARLRLEPLECRLVPTFFYVAPTGNDAGAGSSLAPWKTLQHAVDSIHAGDTILVKSGTYAGCRIGTSGQPGAPCTLKADAGAHVLVNAAGPGNKHQSDIEVENFSATVHDWVIDGFEVANSARYGIDVRVTDSITVQNCYVHNSALTGIFLAFSDHPLIQNNETAFNGEHGVYDSNSGDFPIIRGNRSHDNVSCGIHMNADASQGGDGIISGALVTGNVIYNNGTAGGSGINCDGVQNSRIENNLLYNNHASGISLYRIDAAEGAKNDTVVNNTILVAADGRWALNIQNASTGTTAFNNILYDANPGHGSIDISADSLPGFTSDYNVVVSRFTTTDGNTVLSLPQWQQATGQDQHSVVAAPAALFVNPAGSDYHLAAGSPAIDVGTSANAPAVDIEGSPRPSGAGWDIGAYEYQQAAKLGAKVLAAAEDAGGPPTVHVYDAATGALGLSFNAYDVHFLGGVRVAVGAVTGTGPDVVTVPGPGGGPDVRVFDTAGKLVREFMAYDPSFTGGVYVAAGDVNGDGFADVITGADAGGGPHVKVFSGKDGSVLMGFFAYGPGFTGGVRVAAGDVNGDGRADIITGAGPGGGPHVEAFSGKDGSLLQSFMAYAPGFTGGVYVAAGDVNGDGKADVITGPGKGGGPHVEVFSGADGSLLRSFMAYGTAFTGGVRVASVADVNNDGKAEIVTGAGPGGGPHVQVLSGADLAPLDSFFAFGTQFGGGVFVGG